MGGQLGGMKHSSGKPGCDVHHEGGQMLLLVCVVKGLYLPKEAKKRSAAQQGQKEIILMQKDAAATERTAKQDYLNPKEIQL